MAHLLGAENISLEFPTKKVFDGITIGVNDGDRIGIVGRNGDGKSTLLKLLAKRIQPDEGRITHRNSLTFGLLDQSDVIDPGLTIGQSVVGDVSEHIWAGNPKIRDVISGLLNDLDWNKQVGELSGGQRRRVALAKLLVQDLDIVMLDEPTNHLDIEGVAWLAQHLKNRWSNNAGGLIVVTHDRWFLDEVCNLTWEVHDGVIEPFEGGYAAYILQRNERDRSAAASEARRQNLMRKELAWLRRGAPARTTKPKFRMDAAAELIANEPEPRDRVALSKLATQRLGKDVLDIENLNYSIGNRELLHDVTWRLGPGDRVGLVGVNGAGKTTLLKLIQGGLQPTGGVIKRGKTVNIATLSQEVRELDEFADERIFSLIAREKSFFVVDKKEVGIGQLVEQLGFTQAQLQTPISDLSGGQKRRLQFLRLLFGEPNVLILDEPTNDLDTDILAAMEDLLDGWPGTLIVVSHDRYLLERVTDQQFALLGDGSLRHLPGGVDQYLELRKHSLLVKPGTSTSALPAGSIEKSNRSTTLQAGEGESSPSLRLSGAALREAEKNLSRLERALEKLATDEAKLHEQMAGHDQSDYSGLAEMAAKQAEYNAKRDQLELEWLETSELLQGK
ncbi:ABC-F family ATP-binding cassette domain-containing protein [Rhodoluna lacicola]|uniref:ATPase component of ABC transporters with duplicated ATPase domains n=1 Tax=Rhodoluna lacicola TaxID=529884 RepID=A0A060JD62_9MICO|nr:ABC-F family ATP-binding cassette domain-containing protein [Rhodoluna lacicola]AIC47816.1 ATPase component of ABC transporters with duplicated ATPase domains [Rhodoluna lacicola]